MIVNKTPLERAVRNLAPGEVLPDPRENEPLVKPLSETDAEYGAEARTTRHVQRELKRLQGQKLREWLEEQNPDKGPGFWENVGLETSKAMRKIAPKATEKIAEFGQNVREAAGIISKNTGEVYDVASRNAREIYDSVRESSPVVALEDSGIGLWARRFILERGPTAALGPKVARQKAVISDLLQKQQQEARGFDRLTEQMGKRPDIEKAKKEKVAYFEAQLDKARKEQERLEKKLEAKNLQLQKIKDAYNNKINNKIRQIEIQTNYSKNVELQEKMRGDIQTFQDELKSAKEKFAHHTAVTRQLLNESNVKKSFDEIFNQKPDAEAEKKLSVGAKNLRKGALDSIREKVEVGKMSLDNILQENIFALQRLRQEMEILEKNLKKLQKAKDKIDTKVIHSEHRQKSWEIQRKKLGIANEDVGEHVKANRMPAAEANLKITQITERVRVFDGNKTSTEHWFGDGIVDSCKEKGIDVALPSEQIAKGFADMRKAGELAVFDMEQVLAGYFDYRLPDLKAEVEAAKKEYDQVEKETDADRAITDPNNKKRKTAEKRLDEAKEALDKIEAQLQKSQDKTDEFKANIARIKTEILEKIPADITSKSYKFSELNKLALDWFPDLAAAEATYQRNKPEDAPDMPMMISADAIDQAAEKYVKKAYGEMNDPVTVYKNLMEGITEVKNDASIQDEAERKGIIQVLFNDAVRNFENFHENATSSIDKTFALLDVARENDIEFDTIKKLFDHIDRAMVGISEKDARGLFQRVGIDLKSFIDAGRIDNEQATEMYLSTQSALAEKILSRENANISVEARALADLAVVTVGYGKDFMDEDALNVMFDKAAEHAKALASANFYDEQILKNPDVQPEMNPTDSVGSGVYIQENLSYVDTIRYIQQKFLSTGLHSTGGYTAENIHQRMDNLTNKATLADWEIGDTRREAEAGKSFTYLVNFAADLAKNGHHDDAITAALIAAKIAKNDPTKLVEVATAIMSNEDSDMQAQALQIFNRAYNSIDGATDKLKFDILGVMVSADLENEAFTDDLNVKFSDMYEDVKDDSKKLWALSDLAIEFSSCANLKNKQPINDLNRKILYRLLEISTKAKFDDEYVENIQDIAAAMERSGMKNDAETIMSELAAAIKRQEEALEREASREFTENEIADIPEQELETLAGMSQPKSAEEQRGESFTEAAPDRDYPRRYFGAESYNASSERNDLGERYVEPDYAPEAEIPGVFGGGVFGNSRLSNGLENDSAPTAKKKQGFFSRLFSGLFGGFFGRRKNKSSTENGNNARGK